MIHSKVLWSLKTKMASTEGVHYFQERLDNERKCNCPVPSLFNLFTWRFMKKGILEKTVTSLSADGRKKRMSSMETGHIQFLGHCLAPLLWRYHLEGEGD